MVKKILLHLHRQTSSKLHLPCRAAIDYAPIPVGLGAGSGKAMETMMATYAEKGGSMIPEKLLEILKQDGVAAIATAGQEGPHLVNTWHSYIRISGDGRILIPAGYMHRTQANITYNPQVLITVASSKVQGLHGPGAGFLIKGTAAFITAGREFDLMKSKFDWLRATLAVTPDVVTQSW